MKRIVIALAIVALVAVGVYAQSTYEGVAEGYGGEIRVEVTMDGDTIVAVEVLEHSETPGLSDPAINNIPQRIVENNSTDVDVQSGATETSEGIMAAVENALENR